MSGSQATSGIAGERAPGEPKKIKENLAKRDEIDTTRKTSPLRQSEDAHVIDTTHITFSEQVEEIINLATAVMIRMDHQRKVTTR